MRIAASLSCPDNLMFMRFDLAYFLPGPGPLLSLGPLPGFGSVGDASSHLHVGTQNPGGFFTYLGAGCIGQFFGRTFGEGVVGPVSGKILAAELLATLIFSPGFFPLSAETGAFRSIKTAPAKKNIIRVLPKLNRIFNLLMVYL
jgi:hypothetical protein